MSRQYSNVPDFVGLMESDRQPEKLDIEVFFMTLVALGGTLFKLQRFMGLFGTDVDYGMEYEDTRTAAEKEADYRQVVETLKAEFDSTMAMVNKAYKFAIIVLDGEYDQSFQTGVVEMWFKHDKFKKLFAQMLKAHPVA
jgi:hypothetical protein